eukprot:GHVU01031106.1.p1 GENE.GHVU01031106.1~~GHVU01031106.1.p1  ORF type:complete len:127 (+),score=4.08 GHVU01031106.1:226-606(+)
MAAPALERTPTLRRLRMSHGYVSHFSSHLCCRDNLVCVRVAVTAHRQKKVSLAARFWRDAACVTQAASAETRPSVRVEDSVPSPRRRRRRLLSKFGLRALVRGEMETRIASQNQENLGEIILLEWS